MVVPTWLFWVLAIPGGITLFSLICICIGGIIQDQADAYFRASSWAKRISKLEGEVGELKDTPKLTRLND